MREEKQNDISIFVCAHKDFDCVLHNNIYKIICGEGDNITKKDIDIIRAPLDISNIGFSEWSKIFYLWKNKLVTTKYVGIAHYRRIMRLSDDINETPDINKLFDDCDVLVGEIVEVGSVYDQYEYCHNIEDLLDVGEVIIENFPDYVFSFADTMNDAYLIMSNIIVLSKDDFYDLCDFMFGVLFAWCDKVGIDKTKDESFLDYVDNNIENYSKLHKEDDVTFREQARIPAFLSERLLNVWVVKNEKRIKEMGIWGNA